SVPRQSSVGSRSVLPLARREPFTRRGRFDRMKPEAPNIRRDDHEELLCLEFSLSPRLHSEHAPHWPSDRVQVSFGSGVTNTAGCILPRAPMGSTAAGMRILAGAHSAADIRRSTKIAVWMLVRR